MHVPLETVPGPPGRVQEAEFTGQNARFFDKLCSLGGSSKTGPLRHDTDYVASYVTSR
jgi:hypothetical protein